MGLAITMFKLIDTLNDKRQNGKIMEICDKQRGENVCVEYDVRYSERTKNSVCDYYYYALPQNLKSYPVMVYIHGGGFVAGNKKHRRALCTWFAALGFFVMDIDYNLCDDNIFPTPVQECVDAVNHLSDIADKYNLNLDKITVSGDSAGGYYAAMTALLATDKDLQKRFDVQCINKINTAVLNCGIYDLDTALSHKSIMTMCNQICKQYTGYPVANVKEFAYHDVISPLPLLHSDFPESFIIHTQNDIFCKSQGEKFIKRLKELNVKVEEFFSTKQIDAHCFSLFWDNASSKAVMAQLKDFLQRKILE